MSNEELITLKIIDYETIALWKVFNSEYLPEKNIFFTIGTFSNKKICLPLAQYFVDKDYVCWILERRNHGQSPEPSGEFDFSTIVDFDVVAAFEHLFTSEKLRI